MTPEVLPSQSTFQPTLDYIFGQEPGRQVVHVGTRGVYSIETAGIEMEATAGLSRTCSKPALLILMKYPAGIRFLPLMADRDALRCAAALGLTDNQIGYAAHEKNGNFDLHVVVNRVDSTGKCGRTPFILPTLYRVGLAICAERKWPIPANKYNGEPRSDTFVGKTKATYYSHARGDLPWAEAIAYPLRSITDSSRDWPEFLGKLSQRGLSIELTLKEYIDGNTYPILIYHLVDYPNIRCNASVISHEAKFESLVKKFGELPNNYLDYLPTPRIGTPARTRADLHRAAGKMVEKCVEEGTLVVAPPDRELILARKTLRENWLSIRSDNLRDFKKALASPWARETEIRSAETSTRRQLKKSAMEKIRALPAKGRAEEAILLENTLRDLYRADRQKASRRWRAVRRSLEVEFPFLDLDFIGFVRRCAQNGPGPLIVHRDHVARSLVGIDPNIAMPAPRHRSHTHKTAPNTTTDRGPLPPRRGPIQT
jgi:hypothetical protein